MIPTITLRHAGSFTILGGATDYLLGCLSVGGHGAISGLASLAPRVCVRAFDLVNEGRLDEALELQKEMSKAEWGISKGGLLGNKVSCRDLPAYADFSTLLSLPTRTPSIVPWRDDLCHLVPLMSRITSRRPVPLWWPWSEAWRKEAMWVRE